MKFAAIIFLACVQIHAIGMFINPFVFPSGGGYPSGIFEQLDASILGLSDLTPVQTWTATVGVNATQSDILKRPLYRTAIQNGLGIVRFNGVNSWMSATFAGTQTQPFSVLVVFKNNADDSGFVVNGIANNPDRYQIYWGGSGLSIYAGSGIETISPGFALSWRIVLVEFDGSNTYFTVNGGSRTQVSTDPGTGDATGLTIGISFAETNPASQDVGEIVFWNRALGSADASIAMSIANAKWSIF